MASAGFSTCSADCSGRPTRRCSMRPASPRHRISCIPAITPPATARANGSSCIPSASAAFPGGRWVTDRTGIRCGRASSTSPANSSSRTTRCGSRSGRPSATPAVPGCTAAATASTSPTASWNPGRSPSMTTAGSPTRGASTAASRAPAAPSGWTGPTAATRCCPASATTYRSSPATCCISSPGAAAAGATDWNGTPDLVALEVRRGLVSAGGARRYGVVVDDDGALDAAGTDALRTEIRSARVGELAGLRHGSRARGTAGTVRGGDGAAGAEGPGLAVTSPAAGTARVRRPAGLGRPAGAAAGRPDAGVLHRRQPARSRVDRRGRRQRPAAGRGPRTWRAGDSHGRALPGRRGRRWAVRQEGQRPGAARRRPTR